jgi:bifunctional ADP-heptose synthase (sugar kinase/adenylyltransferase)
VRRGNRFLPPTVARQEFDVSDAGDTVIAVHSLEHMVPRSVDLKTCVSQSRCRKLVVTNIVANPCPCYDLY